MIHYPPSRTAEIMSRYRPIAPKPEPPHSDGDGITNSAYMRNVWAHLQARPTRTRKRGRTAAHFSPQAAAKKHRGCLQGLTPPFNEAEPVAALPVVTGIDLNAVVDQGLEELDFLQQLQKPIKPVIISPRPVRPVGSTIIVERICDGGRRSSVALTEGEEVEAIMEAENVPECGWLDCAALFPGGKCRRIGGGISLKFVDSEVHMIMMHGFHCEVTIQWESHGKKKSIAASCNAEKIYCPAKNYQFLWRFKTVESPESGN